MADVEAALRLLIEAVEKESGATKELYQAALEAAQSLPPAPDAPLETATFFASDYGVLGKVRIDLPRNNGGDEQFDADFTETIAFVSSVISRRKAARKQALEEAARVASIPGDMARIDGEIRKCSYAIATAIRALKGERT